MSVHRWTRNEILPDRKDKPSVLGHVTCADCGCQLLPGGRRGTIYFRASSMSPWVEIPERVLVCGEGS